MTYTPHSFTFSAGQKKAIEEFYSNNEKELRLCIHHSNLVGPDKLIITQRQKTAILSRLTSPNKKGFTLIITRTLLKQNKKHSIQPNTVNTEKKPHPSVCLLNDLPANPWIIAEAKRIVEKLPVTLDNEEDPLRNQLKFTAASLQEKLERTAVCHIAEVLGEYTNQDLFSNLPPIYRSLTVRPRVKLANKDMDVIEFFY